MSNKEIEELTGEAFVIIEKIFKAETDDASFQIHCLEMLQRNITMAITWLKAIELGAPVGAKKQIEFDSIFP